MLSLIFPIIAILWAKLWTLFDKINFNKTNFHPSKQIFLVFVVMFLCSILWFFIIWEKVPEFSLELYWLVLLIIFLSFFQNYFQFHGISKKDLQVREPISLLWPLITAWLWYVIFPSERELKYIVAIFLALLVLYAFNFKKNFKVSFDKGIIFIFLWVLFGAVIENIFKYLLLFIWPEYLLLLRSAGILILLLVFKQVLISKKHFPIKWIKFWLIAWFFYFAGHLARLYSIQELWLNLTVLLLFLGPVLIFFFSFFILKEKVELKNIISSFLILSIVLGTIII